MDIKKLNENLISLQTERDTVSLQIADTEKKLKESYYEADLEKAKAISIELSALKIQLETLDAAIPELQAEKNKAEKEYKIQSLTKDADEDKSSVHEYIDKSFKSIQKAFVTLNREILKAQESKPPISFGYIEGIDEFLQYIVGILIKKSFPMIVASKDTSILRDSMVSPGDAVLIEAMDLVEGTGMFKNIIDRQIKMRFEAAMAEFAEETDLEISEDNPANITAEVVDLRS